MPKPRRSRSIAFQASLQRPIHSQAVKLATIEQQRPPTRAGAQARLNWQNQVAQLKNTSGAARTPIRKGGGDCPERRPSMPTPGLMSLPLKNCVSTILSLPVNGTPYSDSARNTSRSDFRIQDLSGEQERYTCVFCVYAVTCKSISKCGRKCVET